MQKVIVSILAITIILTASGCREAGQTMPSSTEAAASIGMAGSGTPPGPARVTSLPDTKGAAGDAWSGGQFIAESEALSIARSKLADPAAVWSARQQLDQPVPGLEDGKPLSVWIVEARFPAGNLTRFILDARTGAELILIEQEASFRGDDSPAVQPSSLELTLVKDEGGFHLSWDKNKYTDAAVVQTLRQTSEESNKLVVHLIRRLTYANGGGRYLLDAAIVNPVTAAFRVVPLCDVPAKDEYAIASLAKAFGFRGADELILVRPSAIDGQAGLRYDAVSLQLVSGTVATLAEGVIPDPSPDFLAAGWLGNGGQLLYLNSFENGELWIADLAGGHVEKSPSQLKQKWPMTGIGAAEDGNLFWHMDHEGGFIRVYDESVRELTSIPNTSKFHSPAGINWSPDSQHGLYEYSFDQSAANVIWQDVGPQIMAPQGIRLIGRHGEDIWTKEVVPHKGLHMEWAGWFASGDEGLVRFYELERREDQPQRKIHTDYALIGLEPDSPFVFLHRAEKLEELNAPEPAFGSESGRLVLVDRKSGLYWECGADYTEAGKPHAKLISRPGDKHLIWAVNGIDDSNTTVYRYDSAAKSAVPVLLPAGEGEWLAAGPDLIVDSYMHYYRVP